MKTSPSFRFLSVLLIFSNLFFTIHIPLAKPAVQAAVPATGVQGISPQPTLAGAPDSPQSSVDTISYNWGRTTLVRVHGSYAYVAGNDGTTLEIFDVSNIALPKLIWSLPLRLRTDQIFDIEFQNNFAYLVLQQSEILTLDITNPNDPILIARQHFSLPCDPGCWHMPNDSQWVGNYLYVITHAIYTGSDYGGYVSVLDLNHSTNLYEIISTSISLPGAYKIRVSGSHAFVVGEGKIYVLDLTDPASPQLITTYDSTSLDLGDLQFGVLDIVGQTLYAAGPSGKDEKFDIFDIHQILSPVLIASINFDGTLEPWSDLHIDGSLRVSGSYAYILGPSSGITVINISDSNNPKEVIYYAHPGFNPGEFDILGDRVIIADLTQGLKIIDFSMPDNPILAGRYLIPGDIQNIVIQGNYAFLSQPDFGLIIVDVSESAAPRIIGSFQQTAVTSLAVQNNLVYLKENTYAGITGSSDGRGFYIIDVTDPTHPTLVSHDQSGHSCYTQSFFYERNIIIKGQVLFTSICNSILAIDISNPYQTHLLNTFYGDDFTLDGSFLYSLYYGSLMVEDVSDPLHPVSFPSLSVSGMVGLAANGNYMYLTDQTWFNGHQEIIDITDRGHPTVVNILTIPVKIEFFYKIIGQYLYGICNMNCSGGIDFYSLNDPALPEKLDVSTNGRDVDVYNGNLFIAGNGLTVAHLNYFHQFNISGKVLNTDGSGLGGVIVTDNASHIAITGDDGSYTLTNILPGTYDLTPAKGGLSFSPEKSEVTVQDSDVTNVNFTVHTMRNWLLMFYLDGDNGLPLLGVKSLTPDAQAILQSLKASKYNANVDIAVLYDGDQADDTQECFISTSVSCTYIDEMQSNNLVGLEKFIDWAKGQSTATHTAFTIFDHGSLAGTALDWDRSSIIPSTVRLTPTALSTLLTDYSAKYGKLDVLYLYSCLMGFAEIGYEIRNSVNYLVASENVAFSYDHFDIDSIDAQTTPQEMAINFAKNYQAQEDSIGHPYTISVADLAQADNLAEKIKLFANELNNQISVDFVKALRQNVIDQVQHFDENADWNLDNNDESIDLYDFALQVKFSTQDQALKDAAQGVLDAIRDKSQNPYIVYNFAKSGYFIDDSDQIEYYGLLGSHGVSIFFTRPENKTSFYSGGLLQFASGTDWHLGPLSPGGNHSVEDSIGWGSFLVSYIETAYPNAPDDPNLPVLIAPIETPRRIFLPVIIH